MNRYNNRPFLAFVAAVLFVLCNVWAAPSKPRTLEGHSDAVMSTAFSPDGKTLATGGYDKTIKLWNVTNGQLVKTFKVQASAVLSVAFSPDGSILANSNLGKNDEPSTVKLWSVATGQLVKTLTTNDDFNLSDLQFSRDGHVLVASTDEGYNRRAIAWNMSSGKHTQYGNDGDGTAALTPDDRTMFVGDKLYDINSGQLLKRFETRGDYFYSSRVSPDGLTLVYSAHYGDWTIVELVSTATGKVIKTLEGHKKPIRNVAFSPDGRMVATASDDGTAKLWDASSGELISTLEGHLDAVYGLSFSPDGHTLATGSQDSTVKLWDISGEATAKAIGQRVTSVAFSPDGRVVASGNWGSAIKLWDSSTGALLVTLEDHTSPVTAVVFSPDGRTLATASHDGTAKLWDVESGQMLKTFKGHLQAVTSVAFSPDGLTLATGSQDNTVKLWNIATGQCINTLESRSGWVTSVAFSPDGRFLAMGGDVAKVWTL